MNRLHFSLLAALLLCIPSLGIVQRALLVGGNTLLPQWAALWPVMSRVALPVYLLTVWGLVFKLTPHRPPEAQPTEPRIHATAFMAAILLVLLVLFFWLFPLFNSGVLGFASDRDEAVEIGVTELLHGRYPYYSKTFTPGLPHEWGVDNNPISPWPGGLLLAFPFVLLGRVGYQNLFWLGVFFWAARRMLQRGDLVFKGILACLLLSPVFLAEIMTGGDALANGLWVITFMIGASGWIRPDGEEIPPAPHPLWFLALGIGLSSRPHFLFLLAPWFATMTRRFGVGTALRAGALTVLAFVAVSAPFYLYDPAGFSPLHAQEKLSRFRAVLPYADLWIILLTGAVSLGLASMRAIRSPAFFLGACAVILLLPVLAALGLSWIMNGVADWIGFAFYAISATLFGGLGLCAWRVCRRPGPRFFGSRRCQ